MLHPSLLPSHRPLRGTAVPHRATFVGTSVTRPWLASALASDMPVVVLVAVAFLGSAASAPWSGWAARDALPGAAHAAIAALLWALGAILGASLRRRRELPLLRTVRAWLRRAGGPAHVARVVTALGALVTTGVIVSGWKRRLGHYTGFGADPLWHRLDVTLHAGRAPSAWLAPLLERPALVAVIEVWYYPGCFAVALAGVGAILWAPADARRTRLLVTLVLVWLVLGGVGATWGASAGPLFYGLIVDGPDPYAWQLARLSEVPTGLAWRARAVLWSHQPPAAPPASGAAAISAMPSMHVATMATFLLAARVYGGPWLRRLAWLALALTLLGSVLLGLHYAVDGYAALLGVAAIWWGVGRAQRWTARDTGTA